MTTTPNNSIKFGDQPAGMEEVIRLDKEGFHYRGQFIADAGEARRLMVEYLKQNIQPKPEGPTDEELDRLLFYEFTTSTGHGERVDAKGFARAVLTRWGRPAAAAELERTE